MKAVDNIRHVANMLRRDGFTYYADMLHIAANRVSNTLETYRGLNSSYRDVSDPEWDAVCDEIEERE